MIIREPLAVPDLGEKEFAYLKDAFSSTWISSRGKYIDNFEKAFSKYCGTRYGVAVTNGTAALHIALVALGIGKGDEVILPDLTFAATINVVLHSNATPVIVDIERDSWCIDPREIEKAITPRTKAIIPVHLYGQPCDMSAIVPIARKHSLFVIEDCAEAHGAKFDGKRVGSWGDIGCFSFYGNKVITTGEGGMCVTNSKEFNKKLRLFRDHGMDQTKKYWHHVIGYNYRMTNLAAAIGLGQLERIDGILDEKWKIEEAYQRHLAKINHIEFQKKLSKREKITWLVSILIKNGLRDRYEARLRKLGFDARHFFYPLSRMEIYKPYVFSSRYSREIARQGLLLPTHRRPDQKMLKTISKVLTA